MNSPQTYLGLGPKEILSKELELFLDSTRLSMRQISKKIGITCSYLSQIKAKKKNASIEVGLKILEMCKSPVNIKQAWLNTELQESGDAYHKYMNQVEKQESADELRKSATRFLCAKLEHLNIYVDIVNEKESGLSQGAIIRKYGQHGLNTALALRDHHLIDYSNMRFYKSDLDIYIQRDDAFSVVKSVFEDVQVTNRDKNEDFQLKFYFKDLTLENADKVAQLYEQYQRQILAIYKDDSQVKTNERRRVFFQLSHAEFK